MSAHLAGLSDVGGLGQSSALCGMGPSMGGSENGSDEPAGGSMDALSSNMAPFLTKLFQIVSAPATDRCIAWTGRGDSFVISDPDSFAREILPTYFKHNNIRSFVRQLNTYGFRKRTNISSTDEHLEFFHEKFRRDQPSMLMQIKRCHQPKPQARAPQMDIGLPYHTHHEIGGGGKPSGTHDIDSIKNRVGELKSRLGSLQSEIRDYNTQMEHKVNLLMQILQSSVPSQAAMQLQLQQQAMLQQQRKVSAHGCAGSGQPTAAHLGATGGLAGMSASMDLLSRRDELFNQLGGQAAALGLGGGMAGLGALGNSLGLAGLTGSLGGANAAHLMGSLGGMSHMQKPGEVAGLQVLPPHQTTPPTRGRSRV